VIEPNGLGNSDGLFLRGPEERKFYTFGQSFRGKLGRLTTCCNRLNYFRREERQPQHPSSVTRADPCALGDFGN
jgi:hypothetical protein